MSYGYALVPDARAEFLALEVELQEAVLDELDDLVKDEARTRALAAERPMALTAMLIHDAQIEVAVLMVRVDHDRRQIDVIGIRPTAG